MSIFQFLIHEIFIYIYILSKYRCIFLTYDDNYNDSKDANADKSNDEYNNDNNQMMINIKYGHCIFLIMNYEFIYKYPVAKWVPTYGDHIDSVTQKAFHCHIIFICGINAVRTRSRYDTVQYNHYGDTMMSAIASQITSLTIVYSIVY